MGGSEGGELPYLRTLYLTVPPLSIFGSAFVLLWIGFIRRKDVRGVLQFVLCQAACDLLFSLKFLISGLINNPTHFVSPDYDAPVPAPDRYCVWLGAAGQFFGQATVSWNMMISVRTFLIFYNPVRFGSMSKLWFHAFVWGWTVPTTIWLIVDNQIGPTVDGCWITGSSNKYRFYFFDLPTSIYFFLSIVILIYVLLKLRKFTKKVLSSTMVEKELSFRRQLIAYIVMLIAVWAIPVTLRVLESFIPRTPVWVIYADAFMVSIQGFANAIVWLVASVSPCKRRPDEASEALLVNPSDAKRRQAMYTPGRFESEIRS